MGRANWNSETELFELARRDLYAAVVGDIMDVMGLRNQFLPPTIRPLTTGMVVVGKAMTVLEKDRSEEDSEEKQPPFGLMLRALDDLKRDEVYLCTGASARYALWGELMSNRARSLGAAGAVLNGYSRDTEGILEIAFPTFSYGGYAQDQAPRGIVVDFRVPVTVGAVQVEPGDMVFGDRDGVCIIPYHAHREVFARAMEKARKENVVRQAIQSGMSAQEAFDTYGVL